MGVISGGVLPVRLAALTTAVPPHVLKQSEVMPAALGLFQHAFDDLGRLAPLFVNAGIERRYSCLPIAQHLVERGFGARNRFFIEQATALLVDAGDRALAEADLPPEAIDAVVTVTSTGIATPSLDALVAERLGLRADVERTPLFGLGCAGGVLGLARAAELARAKPGSRVLLLVVELCTLALRLKDMTKANLVACALFGDGAAALVLTTAGEGPWVGAGGEYRWPDTLDVMGWKVEDDGLGVVFSINVPEIARRRMGEATAAFLARHGEPRAAIDRWICHPGGAKVLNGLREALDLDEEALDDARIVLRDYGNMSSATVLFVLQRALQSNGWRRGLMTALGPGFTAGFAMIGRDR